jgi:hypothetical protein
VVHAPVALVVAHCVSRVELAEALRHAALVDLDDEVVVIAHQAVGMDLPAVPPSHVSHLNEESAAIEIVLEDRTLVVAATRDVVDPGRLVPAFVRHGLHGMHARIESGAPSHSWRKDVAIP